MQLKDIIDQLAALNQALSKAEKKQISIDKQSEKLADSYKTASINANVLVKQFDGILPTAVVNRFRVMADTMDEGVKLAKDTAALYSSYKESLAATTAEYARLTQAVTDYTGKVANAGANQIADANQLAKMYTDQIKYRKAGNTVMEAQTKANIAAQMNGQLSSGKALFQQRLAMEGVRISAEKLKIKTDGILDAYKKSNRELNKFKKEHEGWSKALNNGTKVLGIIKKELTAIAGIVGVDQLIKSYFRINELLIDANSDLATRLDLTRTNYKVQLKIGASSENIAKAQRALLLTGQKQMATDTKRVSIITMMAAGLGISEDASAQLALSSDLTGNNFEAVADALALVVDRTQLTGAEAVKLANTLTLVQRNLGLVGGNMPEIVKGMGAVEGALKGMGGSEGMVGRLMEHFSSIKGIGDAMMFGGTAGILNPDDFNDVAKMQRMVQNTGMMLQQQTGGNALMVAQFARQLEMSAPDAWAFMRLAKNPAQLAKMIQSYKDANAQLEKTSALEKRYRDQLAESGKLWPQLKNQFSGVIHMALIPLLDVLVDLMQITSGALTQFKSFTDYLETSSSFTATSFKALAKVMSVFASTVVGGVMLVATISLSKGLWNLGMTMKSFAVPAIMRYTGWIRVATISLSKGLWNLGMTMKSFAWPAIVRFTSLIRVFAATALGTVVAVVGALWGLYKIGQLIYAMYEAHKARAQEKESAAMLKSQQDAIRQKYNIPASADVNTWLRSHVQAQSATVVPVPSSSVPFQRSVMPARGNMSSAGVSARAREAEANERNFNQLTGEVKKLQTAVNAGADKQVKVAEKGTMVDLTMDRLHRENDALRSKPVTTYGLETHCY